MPLLREGVKKKQTTEVGREREKERKREREREREGERERKRGRERERAIQKQNKTREMLLIITNVKNPPQRHF